MKSKNRICIILYLIAVAVIYGGVLNSVAMGAASEKPAGDRSNRRAQNVSDRDA